MRIRYLILATSVLALTACGGPDMSAWVEGCQQQGYNQGVCECAADRVASNINGDDLELVADVSERIKNVANDPNDPFGAMMNADKAMKSIAADRSIGYFELMGKMNTVGNAYTSAVQACTG